MYVNVSLCQSVMEPPLYVLLCFPCHICPKTCTCVFYSFFLICGYFSGHQTHYEQVGELSGKIEVEGHPPRQVHLRSIRDHTIGIRNWWDLYRYAIHYIYVEEV